MFSHCLCVPHSQALTTNSPHANLCANMPHLTWTPCSGQMHHTVPAPVLKAPSPHLPLITCCQWEKEVPVPSPTTAYCERPLSTCQDLTVSLIRAGPWSSFPGRAVTEPGLATVYLPSISSIPAPQKRDYAQKLPERSFRADVTELLLSLSVVVWQSFQRTWSGRGYDSGPGKGRPSCTP